MVQQGTPLVTSQKIDHTKNLWLLTVQRLNQSIKARNLYFHLVNLKKVNIINQNFIFINRISKKLGNVLVNYLLGKSQNPKSDMFNINYN